MIDRKVLNEVKEDFNLFLFNIKGSGLKELKLSNNIFEAIENYVC